jgi:hypothetical protein
MASPCEALGYRSVGNVRGAGFGHRSFGDRPWDASDRRPVFGDSVWGQVRYLRVFGEVWGQVTGQVRYLRVYGRSPVGGTFAVLRSAEWHFFGTR